MQIRWLNQQNLSTIRTEVGMAKIYTFHGLLRAHFSTSIIQDAFVFKRLSLDKLHFFKFFILILTIKAIAQATVKSWYSEIMFYDFQSGTGNNTIGHFTQVVWNGSKSAGYGISATKHEGLFKIFVVANYYPPGNVKGRYLENVFPKK